MCGRYTLTTPGGRALAERFELGDPDAIEPHTLARFNVCPTEPIAIVDSARTARTARWGLVPPWARELKGFQPINARCESAALKQPFAFAGLWHRRRVAGEPVLSACILTCAANAVCAPVHDRMPCILAGPEEEAAWLAGDDDPVLLAPLDPARTAAAPANPAVNKAGVEGPELLLAP